MRDWCLNAFRLLMLTEVATTTWTPPAGKIEIRPTITSLVQDDFDTALRSGDPMITIHWRLNE
ncbi:hypothetical protein AURDEDRAFT_159169 [Auricularia subglabra TFB-10046 SS5]|nr:hypothetical protein AURDEDRAFT_159169 [Auricularia subglabra TFB-10046 SS5]